MRYTEIIRSKDKKSLEERKAATPQPEFKKAESTFAPVQPGADKQVHLHSSDLEMVYSQPEVSTTDEKSFSPYRNEIENSSLKKVPQSRLATSLSAISDFGAKQIVRAETAGHTADNDKTAVPVPNSVAPPSSVPDDSTYEESKDFEIADEIHIETLSILDEIYKQGKNGEVIQIEQLIEPILKQINVCKFSKAILRKAVKLKSGINSFTSHSLNVAILAIKIGLKRGYSDERLFSLALCALLNDIGMTKIEPAIINKKEKLTTEEYHEIKSHIEHTTDILSKVSDKFPFLIPIVNQVHERENGSGYPLGIKGDNIHEFAKIISLCDVYIALTEPKVNRDNYSGYMALQQIISRRGIDFNPKIIKSLIDVISVFPLESLVKLNNGEIGRVINISSVHPTRPQISILLDSEGKKISKPKFLDLEKEPLLYIEDPDIEEGVVL